METDWNRIRQSQANESQFQNVVRIVKCVLQVTGIDVDLQDKINPFKAKISLYTTILKILFILRSKHTPSLLQKPVC